MTNHELRDLLQELAATRSDGEPVVTCCMDSHWNDEKQRERVRVYLREAAKHEVDAHEAHPQREALERTLARVVAEAGEHVARSGDRGGRGLAIFACESLGLWRVVELERPLPTKLCTGMRPQLLPLARLLDESEPAVVAVVHQRGARIYEVALGGVVGEATVEGPLPRPAPANERGTAEGSQYERAQKNQRHHDKVAERNRNAAAEFLTQRFDESPAHVVLVGPREVVAAFERALPPRVAERVIARRPEPVSAGENGSGRDRLVHETLEAVARKERENDAVAVQQAIGQALGGGLAVLGPDEVVLAVNERRVHRLILEDDFARTGWLCRNCDALGVNHADACTFCSGPLAWVKELGEEIASRVLADDGEVDVVPHDRRLHSYHGVAAMLRQATGRGLGVSEERAPRA